MINQTQEQVSWAEPISSESTIIASWGNDLGLAFKPSTSELEIDLTVELDHHFSDLPKLDLTTDLAHHFSDLPKLDLTTDLAHHFPEIQTRVKNAPRETRKTKRKAESKSITLNETASYLYAQGDKDIRFSEWKSKLIYFSSVKHSLCRTNEAEDTVLEFLSWVIEEDKLKDRTHKKVHFNWVQRKMFFQYMTRLRETQGQDILHRHNSKYCRTQQEKKLDTEFKWVPPTTHSKFNQYNDEGKITNSELYLNDQTNVEEEMTQSKGWSLLFDEVDLMLSDEEDVDKSLWASILTDFFQGTFDGVSKVKREQDEAWANSCEISVQELRSIRRKVLKMVKKNPKIVKIATQYFT